MKKPAFLALDWNNYLPLLQIENAQKFESELDQKLFVPGNVVLANGAVVFCDVQAKICQDIDKQYLASQSQHDFEQSNKNHLASMLTIECEKDEKINIIHLLDGTTVHTTKIVAKGGANLQIEQLIVCNKPCNFNIVEIFEVEQNALVDFCCLQQTKGKGYFGQIATVGQNAQFNCTMAKLHQGTTLQTNTTTLVGQNSQTNISQLVFGQTNTLNASLTNVLHQNTNTTSHIDNLAFVQDDACVHIDGTNNIASGQKNSVAHQNTRMINLGPKAQSVANPVLVIDEFDVKASHAATVGKLDEEQIYYLQSRGLNQQQAVGLLIEGAIEQFLQNKPQTFANKTKFEFLQKLI
jgi:Fe-S cluster assembly protein SufD